MKATASKKIDRQEDDDRDAKPPAVTGTADGNRSLLPQSPATNRSTSTAVNENADVTVMKRHTTIDDDTLMPLSLHRSFVEAVFDVGLQHASPAVIMQTMKHLPTDVNSERVKSHLQKYRKNIDRNKEEFLSEYDAWIRHTQPPRRVDEATTRRSVKHPPPQLHGGDEAARLTCSVLNEQLQSGKFNSKIFAGINPSQRHRMVDDHTANAGASFAGGPQQRISFPLLTEEEQNTPLGASISQVLDLFPSMVQTVVEYRARKRKIDLSSAVSSHMAQPCGLMPVAVAATATAAVPAPPESMTTTNTTEDTTSRRSAVTVAKVAASSNVAARADNASSTPVPDPSRTAAAPDPTDTITTTCSSNSSTEGAATRAPQSNPSLSSSHPESIQPSIDPS